LLDVHRTVFQLYSDCSIYRERCGSDHMVVGFTTICVISAYHH